MYENVNQEKLKTGIYKHFKGGYYHVVCVARNDEDDELRVVYFPLHGNYGLKSRPLSNFTEHVEMDSYSGPRFIFVEENISTQPKAGLLVKLRDSVLSNLYS